MAMFLEVPCGGRYGKIDGWPFVTGNSISVLSEQELGSGIGGSKSESFPVSVGLGQRCCFSPVCFLMWRILGKGLGAEGVRFSGHMILSLLCTDDVVLLALLNTDLQLALGRFAHECSTLVPDF